MQEKRLKEHFEDIPTLDDLYALGVEGFRADIILVDTEKDKKLSMLKQLIIALVKGLSSNPAAMIKKIAGLVRICRPLSFYSVASNQNFHQPSLLFSFPAILFFLGSLFMSMIKVLKMTNHRHNSVSI